jgi:hypothetical protein
LTAINTNRIRVRKIPINEQQPWSKWRSILTDVFQVTILVFQKPSYREKYMEYTKETKMPELIMLSVGPVMHKLRLWWLRRAEDHYLICADVELARAREAHLNMAHYQKQATLARLARSSCSAGPAVTF